MALLATVALLGLAAHEAPCLRDLDSAHGALALAGEWAFAESGDGPAAVAVFRREGTRWTPTQLLALDGAPASGVTLTARAGELAVGVPRHPAGGAVFVFELRDGRWTRAHRVLSEPGFGDGVALGAATLAVRSSTGRVHLWSRDAGRWSAAGAGPTVEAAGGGAAAITPDPAGGRSWQFVGGPVVSVDSAWSGDVHVDRTTGELFESHQLTATGRVKVRKLVPGQGWVYLGTDNDPLTSAAVGTKLSWYNVLDTVDGVPAFVGRSYSVGGFASARVYLPAEDVWVDLGPPGGIGVDEGHYTRLVYDSQDVPIVGYQDQSTSPGNQTTVERLDPVSGTWQPIGPRGINGNPARFQYLGIDALDRPLAAFADDGKGGRVVVMRWEPAAGEWRFVGDSGGVSPDGSVSNVSLLVAPTGDLFVAYRFLNSYIRVLRFDEPSNAWVQHGSGVASAGDAPAIETETWRNWVPMEWSDGRVLVAYQLWLPGDPDDGKAVVRGSDGGAWEPLGPVGFTEAGAHYMAMAVGLDGTPYLAFRNEALGGYWSVMGWLPD